MANVEVQYLPADWKPGDPIPTSNVVSNSPTVTTSQSQSTPNQTAPTSGGTGAGTSSDPFSNPGNDDNPLPTSNQTQQVINQNFANQVIVPQPNVLDQYSSYTYAISWWLLTPTQYNNSQNTRAPSFNDGTWTLLAQSGGSSVGQKNQFFPVDFYLDDLEIETFLMGKGTSMSTNAMELKFKVVEPNGITLIQRLYEAVVSVYKNTTPAAATTGPSVNTNVTKVTPNYAAAIYALTIQFYGYDSNGNLITPLKGQYSPTGQLGNFNNSAVIQKYYPFQIVNITFRTVANQVEYMVVGRPIPYATGTAQARGTIPFAFSLAGQTVGQLLQGSSVPASTNIDLGRQSSPEPATSPAPNNPPTTTTQAIQQAGGDIFSQFDSGGTESGVFQ
jgi:hypothetical protein